MSIARIIGALSRAERRKVGALIVKDQNIIGMGFNGTPSGMNNACEDENGATKAEVLHAEANAIMKVAASTLSTKGATLYVTVSPCIHCAKLIVQSGIVQVYFAEKYKCSQGINLLQNMGVSVLDKHS